MLEGGGKQDGVMDHAENMTSVRTQFGARIRELREREGLTQQKLALMIGIDRTYLSGIENGKRNVSFDNLVKIACGLDVTLWELMRGVEIPSQQPGRTYYVVRENRQIFEG